MVDVFGSCNEVGPPGPKGSKGDNGAIVDPTSSYETYVKYINLRKKNLHSILGLVNITSSLSPHPYTYIQSILEEEKEGTGVQLLPGDIKGLKTKLNLLLAEYRAGNNSSTRNEIVSILDELRR